MNALRAPECDLKIDSPPLFPLFVFSLIFHLIILIVIPLLTHLIWKPTQFVRPQTFMLVRMPQPVAPQPEITRNPEPKATAAIKQKPLQAKKPVPKQVSKKQIAQPKKQEEPENVDELNDLLGGISAPVSEIMPQASNFKYQWYINNLMGKVERFWKPPAGFSDKKDIYVIVSFTIFSNGTISDVAISHSSGNTMLDQLAVRAIKLAAPFGKFPIGYPDNKLEIGYKLRPEIQQ